MNVPMVIMGLLDLAVHPHTNPSDADKNNKKTRAAKFLADTAKRALNLMVLLRPTTLVTSLAKELSLYLGSQHSAPFPHPSLPPLQVSASLAAYPEYWELMDFALQKNYVQKKCFYGTHLCVVFD